MQPPMPTSQRRRELVNLILVVLFMGLLSNILATYVSLELLRIKFLGIPVAIWFTIALILITVVVAYFLILTSKVKQFAIYTNLMVNKDPRAPGTFGAKCIYFSVFAPLAIQRAEELWKALVKDRSPLAEQILKDLHRSESDALLLDLIEYLVFHVVLSGFQPGWASDTIKSYGYPMSLHHFGEVLRLRPSTIYSVEEIEPEFEITFRLRQFTQIEYRDLRPVLEGNQLFEHFLGNTSLRAIFSPRNWVLFTPKGTEISVQREGRERIITLSNRYCTVSLNITKPSSGLGLPYGIRMKEKEYNEKRFFTTDFRIDFKVQFSGWLSFHSKMDDYYNWTQLILKKLITGFSLRRKGFIEEIE